MSLVKVAAFKELQHSHEAMNEALRTSPSLKPGTFGVGNEQKAAATAHNDRHESRQAIINERKQIDMKQKNYDSMSGIDKIRNGGGIQKEIAGHHANIAEHESKIAHNTKALKTLVPKVDIAKPITEASKVKNTIDAAAHAAPVAEKAGEGLLGNVKKLAIKHPLAAGGIAAGTAAVAYGAHKLLQKNRERRMYQ